MKKIFIFIFLFVSVYCIEFECRDQQNNPVDWFIFYKIGRLSNEQITDEHIRNGTGFLYMDANNKNWTLSKTGMESQTQALGYTLQQYYDNQNDPLVLSVFYNDQLPWPRNGTWSNETGHTKGFVVFGEQNGFWIVHSIPKFPRNDTYDYPPNAHYYGQMGICISLGYSSLRDIATQLFYNRPFIYSSKLPSNIATEFPLLSKVIAGEYQKLEPYTSTVPFQSAHGAFFMHFAKAGNFGKDLYFDLVAPTLHVALFVETWQHGSSTSPNINSTCLPPNIYQVFNAKNISLPYNISFTNYWDHSKYAVATMVNGAMPMPWICIGDINRQEHQLVRGGGTMCLLDDKVHAAFKTVISDYYPCADGE